MTATSTRPTKLCHNSDQEILDAMGKRRIKSDRLNTVIPAKLRRLLERDAKRRGVKFTQVAREILCDHYGISPDVNPAGRPVGWKPDQAEDG